MLTRLLSGGNGHPLAPVTAVGVGGRRLDRSKLTARLGFAASNLAAILHTDWRALNELLRACRQPQTFSRDRAAAMLAHHFAAVHGLDKYVLDDPGTRPDAAGEPAELVADPVAVELVFAGQRRAAQLRPVGRDAAIDVFTEQGLNTTAMATQLYTAHARSPRARAPGASRMVSTWREPGGAIVQGRCQQVALRA
ncbi:hypothetical protein SAMN05421805_10630 [Saccharopolyspora antimicrobica]|uniref:Uncharacterized protein n=1 Tax=Saccharopolyspora antimicrobica TaxID=455193 RepID=A0A1I5AWM4_9PSEU|nr:hypothetical protein [Saccharopolyspora antimicrobica]RKT86389.1 hypothetical protein ATL45_4755 [Saccharopolyspora antimicrobica]SFN66800.1 hypothetical protein SAMN05421805_10630 [Saccharopolyspora antimicrobica]